MYPITWMNNTARKAEIGTVIKRNSTIYVYSEAGSILCTKTGGEVIGYTSSSFSIKKGNSIYIFDSKGSILSTIHC